MQKENQSLRFEIELKKAEVAELNDKVASAKQTTAQLSKTVEEHNALQEEWKKISERGDKQTLVLQMMVRTLEDRAAKQAKQILHYQQRLEAANMDAKFTQPLPEIQKSAGPGAKRIHGSVLNFVGPMPPRAMQEKETSSGLWPHRPAVGFPKGKKEKVSRTITTALVVAYSANDTSYLQVIPKVLQSLQLSRERMTLSC